MKVIIRKNDFDEVTLQFSELKEYLLKHENTKHYLSVLIDDSGIVYVQPVAYCQMHIYVENDTICLGARYPIYPTDLPTLEKLNFKIYATILY
jgi:hypothetical protein